MSELSNENLLSLLLEAVDKSRALVHRHEEEGERSMISSNFH